MNRMFLILAVLLTLIASGCGGTDQQQMVRWTADANNFTVCEAPGTCVVFEMGALRCDGSEWQTVSLSACAPEVSCRLVDYHDWTVYIEIECPVGVNLGEPGAAMIGVK